MYYLWYHFQNQIIMKEYTKKPENQSRTLDSNPKASRQAPIDVILQRYKEWDIQRYSEDESEELIQGKFESDTQTEQQPVQREEKPNNTGLPDNLKTGIENLSGYSMDDVKVHYNSDKPTQLNALAYAQGTDIHVAPRQEKHLPHEAWHVVQQKQGEVQPTVQLQGVNVNDNEDLEKEADVMGVNALQLLEIEKKNHLQNKSVYYEKATQLKRERIEENKKLDTINIGLPVQRIVNENVAMNSKIIIDSKLAPDYGDTGTIKRLSRVEEKCMAVEFDNEPGVLYRVYFHEMSVVIDNLCPFYPELKFIHNYKLSEERGENIYYVVGDKLTNSAFVSKEGNALYGITGPREWHPKMEGEDLERELVDKLNQIAEKYYGTHCHIVADEMQKAFQEYRHKSIVYEIYAKDTDKKDSHIIIMGARVRNHYVNKLDDKAYDSRTGGCGMLWSEYLSMLAKENTNTHLDSQVAKTNDGSRNQEG